MEATLSVCLGIGLAAACGFRVFVPFLVLSAAARAGVVALAPAFEWVASDPAAIAFAVASIVEIAAYYVPWIDHLLDVAAGPVAVAAGIVVSASVFTEMAPWLRWTLAAVAGVGAAGAVQAMTTGTRLLSTFKTLGLGNPALATAEAAGSAGLSVLAVVLPVVAAVVAVALLALVLWLARRAVHAVRR